MAVERRSLQRLELSMLLESMPEAVFIFDRDGRVIEVNKAGERMLGGKWESLQGRRIDEIMTEGTNAVRDGRPLSVSELAVTRALAGEEVSHENRVFHKDADERVEATVAAHPIRDTHGDVLGALVLIRDESELHSLQRQLEDTASNLAVGHMAADIAHDFNNVLSTISQASSVLEMLPEEKAADRKLYLKMIQSAVGRGKEIVERMREYLRGSKGEQGEVPIAHLLGEAIDLARPRIWANHSIRLQTDMRPCPAVWGNAADLRRAFINLILNAVEAMPSGGVLTVRCHDGDGKIVTEIVDTGTGISPDDQKKLFSPYFTTKEKGTGLGLSSSKQIVERHSGKLSFHSRPGRTVFRVELPALKEQKAA